MDIFILRHGIAEEHSSTGRDGDRVLTTEGTHKTECSAEAIKALDIKFDLILTSPYARAQQTATIVATELGLTAHLKPFNLLLPGGSLQEIIDELGKLSASSALLVGHEPQLSRLISLLLSGSPDLNINLRKGGFCKLTITGRPAAGNGTLEWLLTAKQLCKMC